MSRAIAVTLNGAAATKVGTTVLQLWKPNPPGYILIDGGWNLGESRMRRSTVDSQYIRGRQLVDAVEDVRTAQVEVHCLGTTGAELKTLVENLRVTFRQWVYTIGWNFDGFTENWQCEPADMSFGKSGSAVDDFNMSYHEQVVSLTIPYFTTDGAL